MNVEEKQKYEPYEGTHKNSYRAAEGTSASTRPATLTPGKSTYREHLAVLLSLLLLLLGLLLLPTLLSCRCLSQKRFPFFVAGAVVPFIYRTNGRSTADIDVTMDADEEQTPTPGHEHRAFVHKWVQHVTTFSRVYPVSLAHSDITALTNVR